MLRWIDSHCHLDAPEFSADRDTCRQQARKVGVLHCIYPAVFPQNFLQVQQLAHAYGDSYAIGIHPLYVDSLASDALDQLDEFLFHHQHDTRLVAIGEIGLDYYDPKVNSPELRNKQWLVYLHQLKLAHKYKLPVLLHSRQSVDHVLKGIRQVMTGQSYGGLAHAFNGSLQQASAFLKFGFKLGFGGACTYPRALHLQSLIKQLPMNAIVLETDSPDMLPRWLYKTMAERNMGHTQSRNHPAQIPAIAQFIADYKSLSLSELAQQTEQNLVQVIPALKPLLQTSPLN